jgi:hypothetical protein
MQQKFIICACNSLDHTLLVWKDEDLVWLEVHLVTHHKFFSRLWYGIRYAFGYKSRFGCWDEFLFDEENLQELKSFLKTKKDGKKEQG